MGLPPLDPALQAQISLPLDAGDLVIPSFSVLYRYLLSDALDHQDASTLAQNQMYLDEGVERELRARWVNMAKEQLLIQSLKELCFRESAPQTSSDSALDDKCRELCYLVSEYLTLGTSGVVSGGLQNMDKEQLNELLTPELDDFRQNIPAISRELSQSISKLERTLRELASLLPRVDYTTTSATTRKLAPSQIPSIALTSNITPSSSLATSSSSTMINAHLREQTKLQTSHVPLLLNTLSTTLHSLLKTQTTLLTHQIHHLETHTHSTQSRNLTTHATFLSTVSQGIKLKTQLLALLDEKQDFSSSSSFSTELTGPDIHQALTSKHDDLLREEEDLIRRERELNGLLGEYRGVLRGSEGHHTGNDDGGNKSEQQQSRQQLGQDDNDDDDAAEEIMRTLGREYVSLEREIEEMKIDVRRLEDGAGAGASAASSRNTVRDGKGGGGKMRM